MESGLYREQKRENSRSLLTATHNAAAAAAARAAGAGVLL